MALLEVKNVYKAQPDRQILTDIQFQQQIGEKVAITGESGAGKSTLLKIISGLQQSDSGSVLFEGKRVPGPEEILIAGHQDIAYLSQHFELHNNYIVRDLIHFRIRIEDSEAEHLYEICKIKHLLDRKTNQLSGGEKQRVALCKLVLKRPKMLLLDEPFSNLDPIHKNILKEVLDQLAHRLHITCLLASHDPQDTLAWADTIIVMQNGRIIQSATPRTIYYNPINQYVAGIFGKFSMLSPSQAPLFGIHTEEPLCLRPDAFSIHPNKGVQGQVTNTAFLGSIQEVTIAIQDFHVIVHCIKGQWKKGDNVTVLSEQEIPA